MSGHGARQCRQRWDDKLWAAEATGVKHNCCCRKRTLLEMALPPWAPLLNGSLPSPRLAMISPRTCIQTERERDREGSAITLEMKLVSHGRGFGETRRSGQCRSADAVR